MNKIIATPHDLRQQRLKELTDQRDMTLECSGALALVYSHFTAFIDLEREGENSREQLTYMQTAIAVFIDAVKDLKPEDQLTLYGYGQAAALRMKDEARTEYKIGGKMTDEDRDTVYFFCDEMFKDCVAGTRKAEAACLR